MTLVGTALLSLILIWVAGLMLAGYLVLPRLRELIRPDTPQSMQ